MTKTLFLDCIGGVAGDMLLAALIDAGASLDAIGAGLPVTDVDLAVDSVSRLGVEATTLVVHAPPGHAHRKWRDIREIIDSSSMPPRAVSRAHAAFALLAKAEGRVHRISPEEVAFHEVGAIDAIVDICGVALALEELGIDEVVCSPLPLGHGITHGAHGVIPLPAPATVELLRGAPAYGVATEGETVTPTGAALVASLSKHYGRVPPMTLSACGTGAGSSDWPSVPNVVRALLGRASGDSSTSSTEAVVLETNIDDMQPEWVPDVLQACLDAGADDAWTTPAGMKGGRPGITLSALVTADRERQVAEVILEHTTTLGLRVRRIEHRWALDRRFEEVRVDGQPISVKLGLLNDRIVNAKPEHRDCVRVANATGQSVKSVWQQAMSVAQLQLLST